MPVHPYPVLEVGFTEVKLQGSVVFTEEVGE